MTLILSLAAMLALILLLAKGILFFGGVVLTTSAVILWLAYRTGPRDCIGALWDREFGSVTAEALGEIAGVVAGLALVWSLAGWEWGAGAFVAVSGLLAFIGWWDGGRDMLARLGAREAPTIARWVSEIQARGQQRATELRNEALAALDEAGARAEAVAKRVAAAPGDGLIGQAEAWLMQGNNWRLGALVGGAAAVVCVTIFGSIISNAARTTIEVADGVRDRAARVAELVANADDVERRLAAVVPDEPAFSADDLAMPTGPVERTRLPRRAARLAASDVCNKVPGTLQDYWCIAADGITGRDGKPYGYYLGPTPHRAEY